MPTLNERIKLNSLLRDRQGVEKFKGQLSLTKYLTAEAAFQAVSKGLKNRVSGVSPNLGYPDAGLTAAADIGRPQVSSS